jgi:hypothetical protein
MRLVSKAWLMDSRFRLQRFAGRWRSAFLMWHVQAQLACLLCKHEPATSFLDVLPRDDSADHHARFSHPYTTESVT